MEIGLSGSNMNNDLVLYRYADVLLMKAEALWRLNPGDGTALMLVNEIRSRAGVDPFTFLDEENLLAERGREMFYENVRRQDLLRFEGLKGGDAGGNDTWWEQDPSQTSGVISAHARNQWEANPNLVQDPGYE